MITKREPPKPVVWLKVINGVLCLFGSISKTQESEGKGVVLRKWPGDEKVDYDEVRRLEQDFLQRILRT